jgi:hypothetical protein
VMLYQLSHIRVRFGCVRPVDPFGAPWRQEEL